MNALMTKREVKMAGYWLISFFCVLGTGYGFCEYPACTLWSLERNHDHV